MAGRIDPTTKLLTELKVATDTVSDDQLMALVQQALRSKYSLVVEQAATLVRARELRIDPSLLLTAYHGFLVESDGSNAPGKSIEDKNCRAKLPLVESLHYLEFDDPDFYSAGMLYEQWEPAWPENQDTAGNLRGAHAFALISSQLASPHETLMKLVSLLFDHTTSAQVHAASAIGQLGHPGSAAVMKATILQGNHRHEVLGECLRSLLRNDKTSLSFIAKYLESDELVIEAASALAEFGSVEGLGLVMTKATQVSGDFQAALFVILGISRHAEALDFLLTNISGSIAVAKYAVKALAPKRFYPNVVRQVEAAVSAVNNPSLWSVFRKVFDDHAEID